MTAVTAVGARNGAKGMEITNHQVLQPVLQRKREEKMRMQPRAPFGCVTILYPIPASAQSTALSPTAHHAS